MESGAILYDEEVDIMAILQAQNEELAVKRKMILHVEERKGASSIPGSAEDFKDWVQDMQLMDLPLNDRKFTWFSGRSCSRIDRVLVNVEWIEEFPEVRLKGGPRGLSDHCPLIVEGNRVGGGPRPFRTLDSWFTHEGFLRMVKNERRNLGDAQFTSKLKALIGPLRNWHKENFGNMDKILKMFEEEIQKLDTLVSEGTYDGITEARRKALVSFCEKWYVRKEVHWKQMSRSQHAQNMDKNTMYFHNIASARRRNNRIDALMIHGRLVRNQARIKVAIRGFYKELYRQEYVPRIGFKDGLVRQIDGAEAAALEAMPSVEEIREAVWDCESSKAPSSDGYNMNFIKKCWEDIGQEFIGAVMEFFQTARLPSDTNVTWVMLAPKLVGAKEIKDFRPISMMGCVYKVISKVLVRKMRTVMPGLVGETQSAFVQGRKIHDGALIVCETVQWLKTSRKKVAIIKLDFQKAYDRVRWSFVDIVLQKMGFEQRWRNWVKECLSTASMSVLVNGSPTRPFKMERGLRQGCWERLEEWVHYSVLVERNHVELSHLQFADDTILFCPTETGTIVNYKRMLRCFELMSGLSINFDKSNLIPINCEQEWVEQAPKKAGGLGSEMQCFETQHCCLSGGGGFQRRTVRYGRRWSAPVKEKLLHGLAMEVGNGSRTLFWVDNWVQGGLLKVIFPRLFSMSNQQGSVIGDCGFWDGLEWIWNFQWRRELFQWELELVHQLHERLRLVLQSETLSEEITSYSFTSSI
nr:uncharacterized protein LOC112721825 [Arachis hypogaea]